MGPIQRLWQSAIHCTWASDRGEAAVTILIKPLLCFMVLAQVAVLFASTIGLVCWLLMKCVRCIPNSAASCNWL